MTIHILTEDELREEPLRRVWDNPANERITEKIDELKNEIAAAQIYMNKLNEEVLLKLYYEQRDSQASYNKGWNDAIERAISIIERETGLDIDEVLYESQYGIK